MKKHDVFNYGDYPITEKPQGSTANSEEML